MYKAWKNSGLSAGMFFAKLKGAKPKLTFAEKIKNLKKRTKSKS